MTNSVLFQAEDGIRDAQESRGLGDVYKRQGRYRVSTNHKFRATLRTNHKFWAILKRGVGVDENRYLGQSHDFFLWFTFQRTKLGPSSERLSLIVSIWNAS